MPVTRISPKERYLLTVRGEETDRPPVWLMRQAGRYQRSYRALREKHDFISMCRVPEVSVAATLLPWRELDVDILIIFNDILIPLETMGLPVEFPSGGPEIQKPIRTADDLDRFRVATFSDPEVAQSLRLLKTHTGPEVPVLGFCGAPFTLATYAVEGKMSRHQQQVKELMFANPNLFHEILGRVTETAANYLIAQIADGHADGVQVFESWGGVLAMPADYEEFAARYQRDLITRVKKACPGVPIHLFVKGSASVLESMNASGADVLSIDWNTPLQTARQATSLTLQGNLDPIVLHVESAVDKAVDRMLEGFDWKRRWIANLGHGILPQASEAAVLAFVRKIKSLGREN